MFDEVEVGRRFKYSLEGVRPQYYSSSPCDHWYLSGCRLHIQAPFNPCSPVSLDSVLLTCVLWGGDHTHIYLVYALVASQTTAWKEYLKCPRNTKYSTQL
jgi:hypothetical protein